MRSGEPSSGKMLGVKPNSGGDLPNRRGGGVLISAHLTALQPIHIWTYQSTKLKTALETNHKSLYSSTLLLCCVQ
jgi:hypothetical protein